MSVTNINVFLTLVFVEFLPYSVVLKLLLLHISAPAVKDKKINTKFLTEPKLK